MGQEVEELKDEATNDFRHQFIAKYLCLLLPPPTISFLCCCARFGFSCNVLFIFLKRVVWQIKKKYQVPSIPSLHYYPSLVAFVIGAAKREPMLMGDAALYTHINIYQYSG